MACTGILVKERLIRMLSVDAITAASHCCNAPEPRGGEQKRVVLTRLWGQGRVQRAP